MTLSRSAPAKLAHQSKKALFFSVRLIWGVTVLIAVCIAWVILLIVFSPFILLAVLLEAFSRDETHRESNLLSPTTPNSTSDDSPASLPPLIFDRRHDVSKLFGCNTRSVRYRWQIFTSKLALIRDKCS